MSATRRLLGLCVVAALCGGCNAFVVWDAPVKPPGGAVFTQYRAPLTGDISDVPVSRKEAVSSTTYFHDWFFTGAELAWDDASIQKAAREGGLSKVYYADYEILQILGVYGKFTVRIYGE